MVLEDITIVYVFFWVFGLKVFWMVLSKVEVKIRLMLLSGIKERRDGEGRVGIGMDRSYAFLVVVLEEKEWKSICIFFLEKIIDFWTLVERNGGKERKEKDLIEM